MTVDKQATSEPGVEREAGGQPAHSRRKLTAVLGLDRSAASKRYARALVRLKDALAGLPGGETES